MNKFVAVVGTIFTILTVLASVLLAIFLSWCKWYGAAWVASHFITSINPVDIGSILFIVETIINICVTLMSMANKKEPETKTDKI